MVVLLGSVMSFVQIWDDTICCASSPVWERSAKLNLGET